MYERNVYFTLHTVKPVLAESDQKVQITSSQKARVTVSWSIGRCPFSISIRRFLIHIYKGDNSEVDFVPPKEVLFVPTQLNYEESFIIHDSTGFANKNSYSVVVEAQREDNESICSPRTSLTCSKSE